MSGILISINILSYNRKEELKKTLTKVFDLNYKPIEIIVVDNASTDGTCQMVNSLFPKVTLISLKENIGVSAWNKGFEIAKGKYVFVLDDDSYPDQISLQNVIKTMENDPSIAVYGFQIFNEQFGIIENINDYKRSKGNVIETNCFIGCGAIIRREIFLKLGAYNNEIFLYYNELEYSIRAINRGYKILFDPNNKIIHSFSMINRNNNGLLIDERRYFHTFRSYFIFLYLHFSFTSFVKYYLKLILSKFYVGIKLKYINKYFTAIMETLLLMISLKNKRKPVKKTVQKYYNYGNIKYKDFYVYYSE